MNFEKILQEILEAKERERDKWKKRKRVQGWTLENEQKGVTTNKKNRCGKGERKNLAYWRRSQCVNHGETQKTKVKEAFENPNTIKEEKN